jgi:hypothetical protein
MCIVRAAAQRAATAAVLGAAATGAVPVAERAVAARVVERARAVVATAAQAVWAVGEVVGSVEVAMV